MRRFDGFLLEFSHPWMDVAFRSERSIEDELQRMSESDVPTVIVSYVIMFIYISLALGNTESPARLLASTRVTLGMGGVFIVLISVFAAVGFYGYVGVPCTMLIIEVCVQWKQLPSSRSTTYTHTHIGVQMRFYLCY